jgi:hypothetical protein
MSIVGLHEGTFDAKESSGPLAGISQSAGMTPPPRRPAGMEGLLAVRNGPCRGGGVGHWLSLRAAMREMKA